MVLSERWIQHKRLSELRCGAISAFDGRLGMHRMFGEHLVGHDRVKLTVRVVFGWEVRVECRRVRLLGLLDRQLLWCQCHRVRLLRSRNLFRNDGRIYVL